jgi:transcriptional regulator with XRE-family HTH domain
MARTPSAKPRSRAGRSKPRLYGRGAGVPNPIDVHVGRRIRTRRLFLDLTQTTLAGALDLTFQQVQKYETGANRVSASRLSEIATFLRVPVSFFFVGLGRKEARADEREAQDRVEQAETIELVRLYYAIPDPDVRQKFLAMVKAAARAGRLAVCGR